MSKSPENQNKETTRQTDIKDGEISSVTEDLKDLLGGIVRDGSAKEEKIDEMAESIAKKIEDRQPVNKSNSDAENQEETQELELSENLLSENKELFEQTRKDAPSFIDLLEFDPKKAKTAFEKITVAINDESLNPQEKQKSITEAQYEIKDDALQVYANCALAILNSKESEQDKTKAVNKLSKQFGFLAANADETDKEKNIEQLTQASLNLSKDDEINSNLRGEIEKAAQQTFVKKKKLAEENSVEESVAQENESEQKVDQKSEQESEESKAPTSESYDINYKKAGIISSKTAIAATLVFAVPGAGFLLAAAFLVLTKDYGNEEELFSPVRKIYAEQNLTDKQIHNQVSPEQEKAEADKKTEGEEQNKEQTKINAEEEKKEVDVEEGQTDAEFADEQDAEIFSQDNREEFDELAINCDEVEIEEVEEVEEVEETVEESLTKENLKLLKKQTENEHPTENDNPNKEDSLNYAMQRFLEEEGKNLKGVIDSNSSSETRSPSDIETQNKDHQAKGRI